MEINLSKLFNTLTMPIRWLVSLVFKTKTWFEIASGKKAKSRRTISKLRNKARNRSRTNLKAKLRKVQLIRLLAVLVFGGVIAGVIGFFVIFAYFSRDLPKPGEVVRREGFSTKIYDRKGKLLYDLFDEERRVPVTYEEMPDYLKQATIAIEDKDFYEHGGFDFMTVVRIPYNLVFRKRLIGGSTLTQQLVKNVLLTNARTVTRKFKELVLAIQLERTFSKDEILAMYLNEAPYGGTAWGVGAAAELYFAKPVAELNLVESAFLAGLPQRPSAYSPYGGKTDTDGEPLWKVRTKGVLRRMKEDNYLTTVTYEQALTDLENLEFEKASISIQAPHFVMYVRDKLVEKFGQELVEQGGLKVTTTLDLELQEKAQAIVTEEVDELEDYKISNGSSVVMDPRTGEIIAMVGSRDYFDQEKGGQFNVATDGLRQPGSSIKPVTYLALFRKGYNPATMLVDVQTDFRRNDREKVYMPRNYDGKYRGPVSVRNSLGSSLNIPAVKALSMVGIQDFLELAYDMGFETLRPTNENLNRFGFAVTLGGAEVHLLDTVTAYSSFANGGLKVEPVSILKVEDRNGKQVYQHYNVKGRRVFSEAEAFLINDVLSDNNARLMAFGPNSLLNTGQPIAVKTGTTNDMRDNWTIGWSQEILVGTWVGNNDNSPMSYVASGVTGASPIWRRTILAALEAGYDAPAWEKPDNIEEVEVDSLSGYPKHDEFPSKKDYVIKGTLPSLPDPIHSKIRVCKGENKLATEAQIADGDYEEREVIDLRVSDPISEDGKNRWMEAIEAWIAEQDDSRYKVPTEYCGSEDDVSVKLEEPDDKDEFDEEDIKIRIKAGSGRGIEKIELYVNGKKRETIEDDYYEERIKLEKGRYEIYAKAYSHSGEKAETDKVRIGTGGETWDEPEPTPTPKPTKKPTVKPTSAPTSTPKPSPTEAETPPDPSPTDSTD